MFRRKGTNIKHDRFLDIFSLLVNGRLTFDDLMRWDEKIETSQSQ